MNMRSFFNKEKDREIRPSTKIVVASGVSGAGVSFVSQMFATGLTKLSSVCLVELGKAHFYDSLGFDKHFMARGYIDFFEKIRKNEKIGPGERNSYRDINWMVRLPEDNEPLSPAEVFRSLYIPKEEYCIFDCSGLKPDLCLNLLAEADLPVLIVDPLPSRLAKAREFLENARISLPEAIIVVNQMNNGVRRSELSHYLGTKTFFSIPSVPQEYIYKAEYNSMPVSDLPEMRDSLAKTQDMLSRLFQ